MKYNTTYEFSEWELEIVKILRKTKLVYTTCVSVNRNRNVWEFQFLVAMKNEVINISRLVGDLTDRKMNNSCTGIIVTGGGMDMSFKVSQELKDILKIKDFRDKRL